MAHMTRKERWDKLNIVYDGALNFIADGIEAKTFKGTGAASVLMERARLEMMGLSDMEAGNEKAADAAHSIGWDYNQGEQNAEA